MGLFCDHNWESRSGMDSGSVCTNCGDLSDREVAKNSDGLRSNKLEPLMNSFKKMSLFCSHTWTQRGGMDSGSVCTNCGTLSDSDRHRYSNYSESSPIKSEPFNSSSAIKSESIEEGKSTKKRRWY